jgi:hypothetical protein
MQILHPDHPNILLFFLQLSEFLFENIASDEWLEKMEQCQILSISNKFLGRCLIFEF